MADILFVGEYCGFVGGIERYMAQAARSLSGHGHNVDSLCFKDASDPELFRSAFRSVISFDELTEKLPRYDLVVVHKLHSVKYLRFLKKHYNVTIFVHDHEFYCPSKAYYKPFTRKNCSRPYSMISCGLCSSVRRLRHPSEWMSGSSFVFGGLWNEIKNSNRFIVISIFMKNVLIRQGIHPEKIHVINPVIKLSAPSVPVPGETPRFLFAGQLIKGKGVDRLLSALPLVSGDFVLDILGSGNDEENLKHLAAPLGDKVRFQAWTSEPEKYYSGAFAMILPWRWQEPFGLVGPEALAHAVPLIGFDVGGIREYLISDETGFLVSSGDIPGLARAMDDMLKAPEKARAMGKAGWEFVKSKFTEENFILGWSSVIMESIR